MIAAAVIVALLLAFLMPATVSRVLLLLPIYAAMAQRAGLAPGSQGYTGMALAAIIVSFQCGVTVLPANAPNLVLAGAAETLYNKPIIYADYLLLHFPILGCVKAAIIIALICRLFPAVTTVPDAHEAPTPMSPEERRLTVILAGALVLWATDFLHGIRPGWIALGAAIFTLMPRVGAIPTSAFPERIKLGSFFYVGAVLGFGALMQDSGVGQVLGGAMLGALHITPGNDFLNFVKLTTLATVTGLITTNPSQPALLAPLAAQMAEATGWRIEAALMTMAVGFSLMILPYQAPPVMVGMQIAGVTLRQILRLTLPLAAICIFVLMPLIICGGGYWVILDSLPARSFMSKLFSPLQIGNVTLPNRITVAPMCQYSAIDGSMTDWHVMHLGSMALSGASMLVIEATGVMPEGRITPHCTGLYSDANEAAMARVLAFVRSISPIVVGIQLGHAGRKASSARPWQGRGALKPEQGAWRTQAPSAIALAADWPTPHELSVEEMSNIKAACVAAVKRAARLGLDFIEMHSTHGYLFSEFLSPLANKRNDEYGGSLQNRMRWPLEVFRAMREAWPADKFSGKDFRQRFAEGGWTADDAVIYAGELKKAGADYVTVSGGGVVLDAKVPVGPGYQVPFAERVKRETGITTGAVGLITDPHQAEDIIAGGKADFISLARVLLFNPRWGQHAAIALGAEAIAMPGAPQSDRISAKVWPPAKTLGRLSA